MTITRTFNLCLNKGNGVVPHINISQYDEEVWKFKLYTENGQRFIPVTGSIIGVKADGRLIDKTGVVDSTGQVVINVTQQMTAAAGKAEFELLIENQTHGTANFIVDVEQRAGENAIPSESDLSLLQEAVNASQEILDIIGDTDLEEVVKDDIDAWLDTHPEATTTVQDDSLTTPKYKDGSVTKAKLNSDAFDGMMMKSISGNPVEFEDGADGIPVKSFNAELNATQDLHGYDHPWVGGAGKNLCNFDDSPTAVVNTPQVYLTNGTYYVYVVTESTQFNSYAKYSTNGSTWNNIPTSDADVTTSVLMNYGYKKCILTVTNPVYVLITLQINANVSGKRIRVMITKDATNYADIPTGVVTGDVKFEEIWTPYENICPIVPSNGVNIWDEQWELGGISNQNGTNYGASDRIRSKNYIPCLPSTTYYFKTPAIIGTVAFYNSSQTFISALSNFAGGTFTTPANTKYIKFCGTNAYGATYNNDISINYPSSYTAYQPYQGVAVDVVGRNLYPIAIGADTFSDNVGGSHSNDNGTLVVTTGTGTSSGVYSSVASKTRSISATYIGAITYSFKVKTSSNVTVQIGFQGGGAKNVNATTDWQTVTISTTSTGVMPFIVYTNGTSATVYVKDFMFEVGSEAHEYVPCVSASYPISLGRDVYGGTLDVSTGVLTVTHGIRTLDGSEAWLYSGNSYRVARGVIPANSNDMYSNMFIMDDSQVATIGHAYVGTTNIVCYAPDASADNLESWKTYLASTPLKVVYPLATPQTYQLTPTQIATALGYNKISCDCNGKLDVIYRVDTTSAIEDLDERLDDVDSITAGTSLAVWNDEGITDKVPYKFRVTGGGKEVGNRALDTIVGGTVAWNQLVQNGNFATDTVWTNESGTTHTVSNETITINTTVNNNGIRQNGLAIYKDHRYIVSLEGKCDTAARIGCGTSSNYGVIIEAVLSSSWTRFAGVVSCIATNASTPIYIFGRNTTLTDAQIRNVMLIDLTQMFGTTIANAIYEMEQLSSGSGVAYFRSLFPQPYYEYNAGELLSVEGLQNHDTVGFNAWDEEWDTGGIDTTTGQPTVISATRVRSKNFIPVVGGQTYYFNNLHGGISDGLVTAFYDANKNYIEGGWRLVSYNPFVVPSNARFMKFNTGDAYGNAYRNDICINLSDSAKNGTYEPYVKHSYPLDDSLVLRGIPKLDAQNNFYYEGDVYNHDGTVTRKCKELVLDGNTTWNKDNDYDGSLYNRFYHSQHDMLRRLDYKNVLRNDKGYYVAGGHYQAGADNGDIVITAYNANIGTSTGLNWLYIFTKKTGSIDTVDKLKTWLASNPITVLYELATPITEQADPYQHVQIIDPNGTEEYVSTSIVPVGHITEYPTDIVAKVNALPKDFSTLIAPTEKTFTATRNYTVNDLLIINNVLYKVTTNIANGATITPNSNVQQTTLGALIKALS